MGKVWLLIVLILVFASPVLGVKQWAFRMTPQCTRCMEGMVINTTLEISNTGDELMELSRVSLADSSGVTFFSSPLNEKVAEGDKITINFQLHLPPPSRGSTLFYKPCISSGGEILCSDNFARMFIKPLAELECTSTEGCPFDESCQNFKCLPIQCSGFVSNHKCNPIPIELILELISVIMLMVITLLLIIKRPRF